VATFVVGAVLGLVVAGALLWLWTTARLTRSRAALASAIGAQAVAHSESVLRGRIGEQLAPMLDAFAYRPSDARFIGSPVDFIVFDGLADVAAGRADRLRRIVLLDVKTGGARLSAIQRRVRDCVGAGSVETYRFEADADA
jgi:predicted Holliday junction resolvase-like endonuclease